MKKVVLVIALVAVLIGGAFAGTALAGPQKGGGRSVSMETFPGESIETASDPRKSDARTPAL